MQHFVKISLVAALFFGISHATPILFNHFPQLSSSIPYIHLCDLPTPVVKLASFGKQVGCDSLYIKRDDLSGAAKGNGFHLYGGNKPRKLEFLLADALAHGARTIITYGCAGSNHALATAVYAKELGLRSILMLKHQPNSYVVRHNLLLDLAQDADVRWFPDNIVRSQAAQEVLVQDPQAYLIPTGGSNAIGTLGFVNAACELYEQIQQGVLPEPDYMYVATGSCATGAGLLLGLKLLSMRSKVVAVCVEPTDSPDAVIMALQRLFKEANEKLRDADASMPLFDFPYEQLIINKKFCGTEYGLFIPEGQEAIEAFKDAENICLEGTYSAKPVAAIMDDAKAGLLADKVVLFWNTYCGIDYSFMTHMAQYRALPQELHRYFEQPVQSLARRS